MVMDTSQFLVIWTNKKRDVATFSRENSSKQCEVTFLHHMSASCSCLLFGWLQMTLILLSSRRHWRQSTLPETMETKVWRGTSKNKHQLLPSVQLMWIKTKGWRWRWKWRNGKATINQFMKPRAAEMLHQLIPRFKAEDLIDEAILIA